MSEEQSIDRKDLKIQALLEKVASLTQSYENQVADLRVELTISEHKAKEMEQAQMMAAATSGMQASMGMPSLPQDVVQGEVVNAPSEEEK